MRDFSQVSSRHNPVVVSKSMRLRQMNAPTGFFGGRYGIVIPKMAANVVGTRRHVSGDIAGVAVDEGIFTGGAEQEQGVRAPSEAVSAARVVSSCAVVLPFSECNRLYGTFRAERHDDKGPTWHQDGGRKLGESRSDGTRVSLAGRSPIGERRMSTTAHPTCIYSYRAPPRSVTTSSFPC